MDAAATPAPSQVAQLGAELRRHLPFSSMAVAEVEAFVATARQTRYAPDQTVLAPSDGPVQRLFVIQRGAVGGRPAAAGGEFRLHGGELFPVGALLGGRAVTSRYVALEDTCCLEIDAEAVQSLSHRSAVFADFLQHCEQHVFGLAQDALRAAESAQALAENALGAPLGSLPRRAPVSCLPATPLTQALAAMHAQRVGSMLVVDAAGAGLGILTRHDLLERVALAQPPAGSTIADVMTQPLHTLDIGASAEQAALLMTRHGIRHLPLTDQGRVVGLISERDLFALHRLSLNGLGSALRAAADTPALVAVAADVRRCAQLLLAQGVAARPLTALITELNDLLTRRLVELVAARRGLDLRRACWLAFGSEGRSEQTIATDQDNGIVFVSDDAATDRPAWLAFGLEVNEALDACGYPLCKGQVMASNPDCCRTPAEWQSRFDHWLEHGAPEDLLRASIYFDFRPLAGDSALAGTLRSHLTQRARRLPRFMKQLADNALRNAPPLNWRGALDPVSDGPHRWIDLKMGGAVPFVDAARLYALAHGVSATNTRERFEAVAASLGAASEVATWIAAFEYLQMFRLRVQGGPTPLDQNPNRVDIAALNELDQRILKESFRVARQLQQRLALDYPG